MAAQVLSFFQRAPQRKPGPADWTQQELAEFYRVESALIRAGIRVGTDRGLSDEDEPWFIFYRADDGEVVIHFARIDGQYIIAGPAYEEIARGFDFSALVRNMVARHPLIKRPEQNNNLAIHPAALLVAIVGTAFFKTGEARAAESGAANPPASTHRPTLLSSSATAAVTSSTAPAAVAPVGPSVQVPVSQAVTILAAAMMAAELRVDEQSLPAAANSAIAAAAQSLDFSDHGVSLAAMSTTSSASQAAHVAPAPSSTETVSSVLALVALLSTLPSSSHAAIHADDLLGQGSGGGGNGEALLLPGEGPVPQWIIDVRLAANGAAEVAAVQLVRAALGDTKAQRVAVIEVEKLPQVLSELIERGAHYKVPGSEAPPTHNDAVDHQPVVTPPTGGEVAPTPPAGDSTPPIGGSTTPPPAIEPITPPVTPPAPVTPTQPKPNVPLYGGFASQDLVKQFVDYFVTHTAHVSIMLQGLQVVIFDSRVTSAPETIDHMTSMTFTFFDGTSVNLVGAQSAFLHHDGLT